MAKSKPSESLAELAVTICAQLLAEHGTEHGTITHLRVKAALDRKTGKINEPAEVWRALACSGVFSYNQRNQLFSLKVANVSN